MARRQEGKKARGWALFTEIHALKTASDGLPGEVIRGFQMLPQ